MWRFFSLSLFVVAALAIQLHREDVATLTPSFIQTGDEPASPDADQGSFNDASCDYRSVLSASACDVDCLPADVELVAAQNFYSVLNTPFCPPYQIFVSCSTVKKIPKCENWPASCSVEWGQWSECSLSCGGGQRSRSRSLPLECQSCRVCEVEYQSCNTDPCGRDCVIGEWSEFGECSISCSDAIAVPAIQTRYRNIIQGLAPGKLCNPQDYFEQRTCTPAPPTCSVNCEVSFWGEWSTCSATCGCGLQHRTRTVSTQPSGYGAPCPALLEEVKCTCDPCPQDCQLSEWSTSACFGDCYVLADDGVTRIYPKQRKTRYIIKDAQGGQPSCPPPCLLTEYEPCQHVPPCSTTCELTEWSSWQGNCPACQPYGQPVAVLYRERQVKVLGDGVCPCTREEKTCDIDWCCEDCVPSTWGDWGSCNPTDVCTKDKDKIQGLQYRYRSVLKPNNHCGATCGSLEDQRSCEICCPRDCVVGPWLVKAPGVCAKTVGNSRVPILCGSEKGTFDYYRDITTAPNDCGIPCPVLTKTVDCFPATPCCPVNCTLADWVRSPCFGCGNGARAWESREILVHDECGGTPCCEIDECAKFRPVACSPVPSCPQTPCIYGEWGNFSACPHDCQTPTGPPNYHCRKRYLASASGAQREENCIPPMANIADKGHAEGLHGWYDVSKQGCCNDYCRVVNGGPEPSDSEGGAYWSCAVAGADNQYSPRGAYPYPGSGVTTGQCEQGSISGNACPPSLEYCEQCGQNCCPVNCEVGEWGAWSDWDGSCDKLVQSRSRQIVTNPSCGGAPCPPVRQHNTTFIPCPVDCKVDAWGPWTVCPSCVPDGEQPTQRSRRRAILIQPANGGAKCPIDLIQYDDCPSNPCDVNCEVGAWTEWNALCSVKCGDGFKSRTRLVTKQPKGFGMACPPLVETTHCNEKCPSCILGPTVCEPCSITCAHAGEDGSQRCSRSSTPLQVEINGETVAVEQCSGDDFFQPCSVPCCPVDCVMSKWGEWSTCVDGVKSRRRTVIAPPSCGGARCPDCLLEHDVCTYSPPAGECEFGEACEEGFTSEA
jgi:hypothetical protein